MLDDQVVGCEEVVVVGGTAAAVAVAAAADVPIGTAAAVAKGLTNAAAVFDLRVRLLLLLPSIIPSKTARTTTLAAAPPPRGLVESHRQRARGDRAGPPGTERSTALPPLPCDWHTHCERGALLSLAGIQLGLRR